MKIDTIRRERRAAQMKQVAIRIRKHLYAIMNELHTIDEHAAELKSGEVGYVGVYKKPRRGLADV